MLGGLGKVPLLSVTCNEKTRRGREVPHKLQTTLMLTGLKPKEIKVETLRIDYLIRTPKVEELSLQPIRMKEYNINHEKHSCI